MIQEPNTYPGPLTEVDFWTERAANLNSIHQQLSSERVKKVAKILELVKSTYYPAFNRCVGWLSCCHSRKRFHCLPLAVLHVWFRLALSDYCCLFNVPFTDQIYHSMLAFLQTVEGRKHSVSRSQ